METIRSDLERGLQDAVPIADLGEENVEDEVLKNAIGGGPLIEIKGRNEREKGTFASPIPYRLASVVGRSPTQIAESLVAAQKGGLPEVISEVTVDDGYINYHLDKDAFATATVQRILSEAEDYGRAHLDNPDTIVADVSSPNICKPMHVGHLRNNVLSDALTQILMARGHEVIRDNHLGDWGTQFGNLMYWYTEHGDEQKLEEEPIEHLVDLYQDFSTHEAELEEQGLEEQLEELRDKGREWFARVERQEEDAFQLWQKFWDVSIERFKETYEMLGIEFDLWLGESWYAINSWNDRVIDKAREMDAVIETDDGVVFIPVYPGDTVDVEDPKTANVDLDLHRARRVLESAREGEKNSSDGEVRKFILVKSDGATTYGTRDLAAVLYRDQELGADRCIYVVASEQDEYFQEMFAAARKLGQEEMRFKHVSYGLLDLPEGTMSTREGRLVRARRVINEAIDRAEEIVSEKNPSLPEEKRREIAKKVGLATVKFENIRVTRDKNVTFDMDEALSFEGDTGPYIQYSDTRAQSILDKVAKLPDPSEFDAGVFNQLDHDLVRTLAEYPYVLATCEARYDAAPLSHYLMKLAQVFNSYYHSNRVLDAAKGRDERLLLTAATHQVFSNGLGLLGIETIEEM